MSSGVVRGRRVFQGFTLVERQLEEHLKAVAIAATLNVVEPMMSGMGGYGTILVFDADKAIGAMVITGNDKAFAAGANRQDIEEGAAALGIELSEHIDTVLEAMQGIAADLELDGRLAQN